jgi:hypothetical protein
MRTIICTQILCNTSLHHYSVIIIICYDAQANPLPRAQHSGSFNRTCNKKEDMQEVIRHSAQAPKNAIAAGYDPSSKLYSRSQYSGLPNESFEELALWIPKPFSTGPSTVGHSRPFPVLQLLLGMTPFPTPSGRWAHSNPVPGCYFPSFQGFHCQARERSAADIKHK